MTIRFAISLFLVLLFSAATRAAEDKQLTVCMEDSFWAPHTFILNGEPVGIHVEMLQHAADALNYQLKLVPVPWLRCFRRAKDGDIDAILSAAFDDARAAYLHYPVGASGGEISRFRITQADEVAVVRVSKELDWNGDHRSLPEPVGSKTGYRITQHLKSQEITVVTTPDDKKLFDMLLLGRVHSLVAPRGMAEYYIAKTDYMNHLRILHHPVTSVSYFMPTSKKGKLSKVQSEALWAALAKVRDNQSLMAEIRRKARADLDRCTLVVNSCP